MMRWSLRQRVARRLVAWLLRDDLSTQGDGAADCKWCGETLGATDCLWDLRMEHRLPAGLSWAQHDEYRTLNGALFERLEGIFPPPPEILQRRISNHMAADASRESA